MSLEESSRTMTSLEDTLREILAHPSDSTSLDIAHIVQAFRKKYDLMPKKPMAPKSWMRP